MTKRGGKRETIDGLPVEAFAVIGEPADPATWRLPHHTKDIVKANADRSDIESTVDWDKAAAAVAALSPRKRGEKRIDASPGAIIEAARHLAGHYQRAGKPLPEILSVLV